MKKILIIALSLSIFLVGCGGKVADDPVTENSVIDQVKEDLPKEKETLVKVTINSTDRTTEDRWDELEEGKELILVDITVENKDSKDYEFNPNYLQMNVEGFIKQASDKRPKDLEVMSYKVMLPGEAYTGIIAFEVDKGEDYRGITYDDFDNIIELE